MYKCIEIDAAIGLYKNVFTASFICKAALNVPRPDVSPPGGPKKCLRI